MVYTLHDNLEPVILIGLPVYTFLLVTMSWRSIAMLFAADNKSELLRMCCAVSSVLFVISDTMIAIDKFHTPIRDSTFWIMSSYYAAQFGITLSVVDVRRNSEAREQIDREKQKTS